MCARGIENSWSGKRSTLLIIRSGKSWGREVAAQSRDEVHTMLFTIAPIMESSPTFILLLSSSIGKWRFEVISQLGKAVRDMTFSGMNFVNETVDNPPRVALSPRRCSLIISC